MFEKSVLEEHHVLGAAGAVLHHGHHLTVLERLLQIPLQEQRQSVLLTKENITGSSHTVQKHVPAPIGRSRSS